MSHVLPVDLTGSRRTKYSRWATILVNPPFESLQHFYDWLFVSASTWLDKGLSHYNLELAFESLMNFYTGEVDRDINAEGVVHILFIPIFQGSNIMYLGSTVSHTF